MKPIKYTYSNPHPIWKDLAKKYIAVVDENKMWWTNYQTDCERMARIQCSSISGSS